MGVPAIKGRPVAEHHRQSIEASTGETLAYLELAHDSTVEYLTHYVDINTMMVIPKTQFQGSWNKLEITADGIDEAILSGLPEGTVIRVDGKDIVVNDGSFEFSTEQSGFYRIDLVSAPYLPERWEIIANEV